ncbi:MAG: hypothetical protein IPH75_06080 [bacterium]|nr:hypothetical protein [bacterium]
MNRKLCLLIICAGLALLYGCADLGSPPAIPVPELSVHGDTTTEGGIAQCEIELSFEAPRPVTVIYTFVGSSATAGQDFIARTDTVTIEATDGAGHHEDHVHVGIELLQDDQIEPIEQFVVRILSASNAVVVEAEASCFVLDDDGVPIVLVRDSSVVEGDTASFEVVLNKPGILPLILDYAVSGGTALATSDFVAESGKDTILPGSTKLIIKVPTVEDNLFEPEETFTVTISNVVNGALFDGNALGTIENDDVPSFAADIQPVLVLRCAIAGCHGGTSAEGGLNLGSATYHAVLHGSGSHGPIVVPGDAAASSLYFKTTSSPQFELRMPPGGPYVPTSDQEKIRDWINGGAPDN